MLHLSSDMTKFARALSLAIALVGAGAGSAADPSDFVTPEARMVICMNVRAIVSSPLARLDANPVRPLADGLIEVAKFFDLGGTNSFERIWIIAGEQYPKGTLIVAQGKFDPDRLRRQFQELARVRKSTVRLSWENERAVLSVDVPHSVQPIPGVPGTVLIADAGSNAIIAAFEKETLLPALARGPARVPNNTPAPMLAKLDTSAAISWVAIVPQSLAAPKGALAGGDQVFGHIDVKKGFAAKCTITATQGADEAQALASRIDEAVALTQQLVPTLAQSSMDPKIISWLSAALKTTQVKPEGNRVNLMIETDTGDQKTSP